MTSVLAMRYASLLHPGAHNTAAPVQSNLASPPANTSASLDHVVLSTPRAEPAAPAPAPVRQAEAPVRLPVAHLAAAPATPPLASVTAARPNAYELAQREANQRHLDEMHAELEANQAMIDSWSKKSEPAPNAPVTIIQYVGGGPPRSDGLAELGYPAGYAQEIESHNSWNYHPYGGSGGYGHGWHGGGGWHGHHG